MTPRARSRFARQIRRWWAPHEVHHIGGPREITLGPSDVIAVSLVRDGERHIPSFLEHHFALGVRHVVLLDNGSIDRTIALARAFDGVTVLQTRLPYRTFKYVLKGYLFDRFAGQGWCLVADIDERFAYPLSDRLPLTAFIGYLNARGYTGVVAHLLDLFPDGPIQTWPHDGAGLMEQCRWYDLSAIEGQRYSSACGNEPSNPTIALYRGGIRRQAFGVNPRLSKHPLLRRAGGARPSLDNAHDCCRARIADVSCALLHYNFDGEFRRKCLLAVQGGHYSKNSEEYRACLAVLDRQPDLTLRGPTAVRLRDLSDLVENRFLVVSDAFRRAADSEGPRVGDGASC